MFRAVSPVIPVIMALAGSLGSAVRTDAATVMLIDVSNPAAVKFTSVAANSQNNSSLNIASDGFTVQNFFSSAVTYPNSTSFGGDLAPTGSAFVYAGLGTFDYESNTGNFGAGNDLSIFANAAGGAGTQVFSTSSRALNGSFTVNFSGTTAALPAPGTTGNIVSGYFQSGHTGQGLIVGQFLIVPEPSAMFACALGLMAFVGKRRR